jgi:protein gp37
MSKIEWASLGLPKGVTWNPIRARNAKTGKRGWHCEKVSPACENCYAERLNAKAGDTGGTGLAYKPGHRQNGDVEIYLDEKTLLQPLSWRAPRGVFVASMTDVFGDWVSDEWLDHIFAVMALCPQHRFAVLTKRSKRMREHCSTIQKHGRWLAMEDFAISLGYEPRGRHDYGFDWFANKQFLPNVYLGVTAEDQKRADERIPDLLATAAAVRFVSIEPMLGPIDLYNGDPDPRLGGHEATQTFLGQWWETGDNLKGPPRRGVDWVIVGGESGRGARPSHPDWLRSLRDQCLAAEVPFFFKQFGEFSPHEIRDGGQIIPPMPCFGSIRNFYRWREGAFVPVDGRENCVTAFAPGTIAVRVGKKRAGRLLDGVEYSEFPEAR